MTRQWVSKRITINLAKVEIQILTAVSEKTGRSFTDLVRESIRITYGEIVQPEESSSEESPRLP